MPIGRIRVPHGLRRQRSWMQPPARGTPPLARIDLVALQQRLAQQQPTPLPAESPSWSTRPAPASALRTMPPPKIPPAAASAAAPAGTLRATTTMRAALPLKATNARAERAEERARANALRAQIDELNAELVVARAEADRALAEERQRVDRLNEQVEALSAEVVRAEKQAEAVVGRAERAEAGRDAERARCRMRYADRIEAMAAIWRLPVELRTGPRAEMICRAKEGQ